MECATLSRKYNKIKAMRRTISGSLAGADGAQLSGRHSRSHESLYATHMLDLQQQQVIFLKEIS